MKEEGKPKKITRRQALKIAGAAAAGLAASSMVGRFLRPSEVFAAKKDAREIHFQSWRG